MPLFTRSISNARSNSATDAMMLNSSLPDGVLVSHESDMLTNATPSESNSARLFSKWRVDLPNRSSRNTNTQSNFPALGVPHQCVKLRAADIMALKKKGHNLKDPP